MTAQGTSAALAQMCLALLHGAGQLGIAESIEAAHTAAEPAQISGIRDTAIEECQRLIDEVTVRGQEGVVALTYRRGSVRVTA